MKDKLRNYIEELFKDAPQIKQTVEIKEEILQNTIDRYDDLIAEGKSPEAAYNISVAGIGDVSHLIDSLTAPVAVSGYTREEIAANQRKRTILLAVAVMLYICSIIPVVISDVSPYADTLGPALMFLIVGIATGLIIYRSGIKLKYNKNADTVVEEFKEWNRDTKERRTVLAAINGGVWALILMIYLTVSFLTSAWYITWLIFPIGGAVTGIISAIFDLTK